MISEDVATNATVALEGPPSTGSADDLVDMMDGRPVAGKTGTSESFRSAWFVGYTPQLVTAVGMFQPSEDGSGEEVITPPWGRLHQHHRRNLPDGDLGRHHVAGARR